MRLNEHQARAAAAPEARVVTVAGAGTGKTQTLAHRTVFLCQRHDRVRLCGYTRASAEEIRARVDRIAPGLEVQAGTVHSIAAEVCRTLLHLLSEYRMGFTIVDGVEEDRIKRDARKAKQDVERVLVEAALLRYDDLLRLALRLAEEQPEAFAEFTGGALIVDEAQDLNRAQWALVAALRPESLTVIGDPAQSIFGFQGACGWALADRERAAAEMPEVFEGARWYALPTNYRSGQTILDVANRLDVPGLVHLEAARGPGGTVREMGGSSEKMLRALTGWIVRGWEQGEKWAILSRTRRRAQWLVKYLKERGVPVHAPGLGESIWASEPARQLLDAFHVVVHPHGTLHLERVLRRSGMTELQLARAAAARSGLDGQSLWNWAVSSMDRSSAPYRAIYVLGELREGMLASATEAAKALDALGLAPGAPVDSIPEGWTIPQMLTILASPGRHEEQPEGVVYVGTLHSAKGREWDNVVLFGCEDGAFPLERAVREGGLDEERRLFYVAVTRARDQLVMVRSASREQEPSRFLAEVAA